MAATRGPVPKRTDQRRRRNKTDDQVEVEKLELPADAEGVVQPAADESWHPLARDWYVSLATSGQAHFFEPSDWQAARFVAESMTRLLSVEFTAAHFAAVWSAMGELLTTEGARRRARLEIERAKAGDAKPAGVTAIDDYRTRLGVS